MSVYFNGANQRRVYQALCEHREAIEAEIGAKLVWSQGQNEQAFEIVLRNPVDPLNESLWPTYYDWMRRSLVTFQRVLGPRIAQTGPATVSRPKGVPSEKDSFYCEYWEALKAHLEENGSPIRSKKPQPQQWMDFAIGRRYLHLSTTGVISRKEIMVSLYLSGPDAKVNFHSLRSDRPAIEAEIGSPLEWRELPRRRQARSRCG